MSEISLVEPADSAISPVQKTGATSLIASNIGASEEQIIRISAALSKVEDQLLQAERGLAAVNEAVGSTREQLTKAATDLVTVQNDLDRVAALENEIEALQRTVSDWIERSTVPTIGTLDEFDLQHRKNEFATRLETLLRALGHGGVRAQPQLDLSLDNHYVPYLGPRRLRSLGSASDHSRLIAAYVLSLAATSQSIAGLHPGFVLLDEPLQQNPDEDHRRLFVDFLTSSTAKALGVQNLVFTWLTDAELNRLNEGGVTVIRPSGEHFLELAQ